MIDRPDKFQHVRIINDTKFDQKFIALKKHYLRNHWKLINNLNSHLNYSSFINVPAGKHLDLLFEVDTNLFSRIAICKITKSTEFPYYSIIFQVPDLKILFFTSEFKPNNKNRIILKDTFEDWMRLTLNLTLLFITIFGILHMQIQHKIKYLLYGLLGIIVASASFLLFNDIMFLLQINKII